MAIADTLSCLLAISNRQIDRIIAPAARKRAYDRIQMFAVARPLLFTFVVAQVLTSLLPVALFIALTSSVLALSVGAALLFSLFWTGVALLFLIPTLFVTVSIGFVIFLWAAAARFAWATLPDGVKTAITSGRPRGRGPKYQRAPTPHSSSGVYSTSYAAAATAGQQTAGDNGSTGNGHANGNVDQSDGSGDDASFTTTGTLYETPVLTVGTDTVPQTEASLDHVYVTRDKDSFKQQKKLLSS